MPKSRTLALPDPASFIFNVRGPISSYRLRRSRLLLFRRSMASRLKTVLWTLPNDFKTLLHLARPR